MKLHRIVKDRDCARRATRAEETEESASHHVTGPTSHRTICLYSLGELGKERIDSRTEILNTGTCHFSHVQMCY